jgi:hypothetical protein
MPTLEAPALQRLYRDWADRRHGREFPARADFDPCDFKYVLGNLALIDVLRDPLRFRFRLHPTNMVARLGIDLTGKLIDEITDRGHYLLARQHFTEVVEARQPVVQNRHGVKTDHRTWNCEILVLPLSNTGADIDMLMGCVIWDEIDPRHPPLSKVATVT